jgi:hypothetical protein
VVGDGADGMSNAARLETNKDATRARWRHEDQREMTVQRARHARGPVGPQLDRLASFEIVARIVRP